MKKVLFLVFLLTPFFSKQVNATQKSCTLTVSPNNKVSYTADNVPNGENLDIWLAQKPVAASKITPIPITTFGQTLETSTIIDGATYWQYRVASLPVVSGSIIGEFEITNLLTGDYQIYCILPTEPDRCAGNFLCDYYGGPINCVNGSIGLWRPCNYQKDNQAAHVDLNLPTVTITSPTALLTIHDQFYDFKIPWIQTSNKITVTGTTTNVSSGTNVVVTLDLGTSNEININSNVSNSSFSVDFNNVKKGEHTIDVNVLTAHERLTNIAVGDIIVLLGDSTTAGAGGIYGPNVVTTCDQANYKTNDCRNFEQTGGVNPLIPMTSFHVDLARQLESRLGYPIFIMNEGWEGSSTDHFQTIIYPQAQFQNRINALKPNKWLINFGVNDVRCQAINVCYSSGGPFTPEGYFNRLNSIISWVRTNFSQNGNQIYMVKTFTFDTQIPLQLLAPSYQSKLDQIFVENKDVISGPDLWNTFSIHPEWIADIVHPNQTGYLQVAGYWADIISQNSQTNIINYRKGMSKFNGIDSYRLIIEQFGLNI